MDEFLAEEWIKKKLSWEGNFTEKEVIGFLNERQQRMQRNRMTMGDLTNITENRKINTLEKNVLFESIIPNGASKKDLLKIMLDLIESTPETTTKLHDLEQAIDNIPFCIQNDEDKLEDDSYAEVNGYWFNEDLLAFRLPFLNPLNARFLPRDLLKKFAEYGYRDVIKLEKDKDTILYLLMWLLHICIIEEGKIKSKNSSTGELSSCHHLFSSFLIEHITAYEFSTSIDLANIMYIIYSYEKRRKLCMKQFNYDHKIKEKEFLYDHTRQIVDYSYTSKYLKKWIESMKGTFLRRITKRENGKRIYNISICNEIKYAEDTIYACNPSFVKWILSLLATIPNITFEEYIELPTNYVSSWLACLKKGKKTNLTFTFDGKHPPMTVHQELIRNECPFFDKCFEFELNDETTFDLVQALPEYDYKNIIAIIEYMYSRDISMIHEENALELANLYDQLCMDLNGPFLMYTNYWILKGLTVQNCIKIYKWSCNFMSPNSITGEIERFIGNYWAKVQRTYGKDKIPPALHHKYTSIRKNEKIESSLKDAVDFLQEN